MSEFEEQRKMVGVFRRETGRDPNDREYLELVAAARLGRDKPFPWTTGKW